MGRKGVSKRKPPKSKISPVSRTNGAVPALVREVASPAPQRLGEGDAISIGKGGKKKSSDARQKNKKR
jgi:hypothetical protein